MPTSFQTNYPNNTTERYLVAAVHQALVWAYRIRSSFFCVRKGLKSQMCCQKMTNRVWQMGDTLSVFSVLWISLSELPHHPSLLTTADCSLDSSWTRKHGLTLSGKSNRNLGAGSASGHLTLENRLISPKRWLISCSSDVFIFHGWYKRNRILSRGYCIIILSYIFIIILFLSILW